MRDLWPSWHAWWPRQSEACGSNHPRALQHGVIQDWPPRARGSQPTDTRLLDDLADIIDSTRARMSRGTPLIQRGAGQRGVTVMAWLALGTL